jgi:TPR repeat protein
VRTLFTLIYLICFYSAFAAELDELTKLGEAGDPTAQSQLGYYYLNGIKTEKNIEAAKRWLQRAAEQGDIDAAYDLGVLFETERNYLLAARYYKSAEIDPFAKLRLAHLYSQGLGAARDINAAAELITAAAESGEAEALYQAGLLYLDGEAVPKDNNRALELFLEAAYRLYPPAFTQVGRFYEEGIVTARDNLTAEIYYQKAFEAGDIDGTYLLAELLERRQDFEKAVIYYTKAADSGDVRSAAKLGRLFENGIGVERDYTRAAAFYAKSVGTDGGFSENRLGAFYRNGLGVQIDPEAAREWFVKSIKQGYIPSNKALGHMYILGNFGEVNQVRGCAYLYRGGDEADAAYCDSQLSPRAQKAAKTIELLR